MAGPGDSWNVTRLKKTTEGKAGHSLLTIGPHCFAWRCRQADYRLLIIAHPCSRRRIADRLLKETTKETKFVINFGYNPSLSWFSSVRSLASAIHFALVTDQRELPRCSRARRESPITRFRLSYTVNA
jgi:hypothetical protein